jgi:hypothetical protein
MPAPLLSLALVAIVPSNLRTTHSTRRSVWLIPLLRRHIPSSLMSFYGIRCVAAAALVDLNLTSINHSCADASPSRHTAPIIDSSATAYVEIYISSWHPLMFSLAAYPRCLEILDEGTHPFLPCARNG